MRTETIGIGGVECRVKIPHGRKRRYDEIVNAADDEGTIQAWGARELFSLPEHHTTMSLARALRLSGFEWDEI